MTEPEQPVVAQPRTIEEAAAGFEASAKTWYRHAEEARREGTVSSIRGHNGIPSEVTAVVRAMTWEAAAVDLRARVEGQPVVAQPLDGGLVGALANIADFVTNGKVTLNAEDVENLKAMLALDLSLIGSAIKRGLAPQRVCDCACGCDNTAEWHSEPRCACRSVGCPCISAEPEQPVVAQPLRAAEGQETIVTAASKAEYLRVLDTLVRTGRQRKDPTLAVAISIEMLGALVADVHKARAALAVEAVRPETHSHDPATCRPCAQMVELAQESAVRPETADDIDEERAEHAKCDREYASVQKAYDELRAAPIDVARLQRALGASGVMAFLSWSQGEWWANAIAAAYRDAK